MPPHGNRIAPDHIHSDRRSIKERSVRQKHRAAEPENDRELRCGAELNRNDGNAGCDRTQQSGGELSGITAEAKVESYVKPVEAQKFGDRRQMSVVPADGSRRRAGHLSDTNAFCHRGRSYDAFQGPSS
jgi:hypothetical protein